MISIILAAVTCVTMIAGVFLFPQIRIFSRRVDTYWLISLLGAVAILLSGQVSMPSLLDALFAATSVNPLKILVLFISMTLISVFLDEVGFFRYLANKALSAAKQSQICLFAVMYLTVSVLTVFTSNDIIVLTFTPFICYFAKNAEIDPKPYLMAEFIAANTMSMMLIIGNPTNIYVASSYGISFVEYFITMLLPTLASAAVAFLILWLIFRKELSKRIKPHAEKVGISDKSLLIIGLCDLAVCTVLLAVGSYVGIEMWFVSFAAVIALFVAVLIISLIKKKKPTELSKTLSRAPWQLIPFVLSMFVIILAVSQNGVTEWIGKLLGDSHTVLRYGVASFLSANVINNIPMSVLFCSVIEPLSNGVGIRAAYASIAGSNLGAYLTPIGALAGIMWMSMLKHQNVKLRYSEFIKYGAAVSVPALFACIGVLSVII